MRLAVFGSGYVGLVSAACFADVGHEVLCVDIDQEKIGALNNGVVPIYEPGLENLISSGVAGGRLFFTTDAEAAVEHAEIIFIAVGTPSDAHGAADMSGVLQVANTIGRHMQSYKLIVNKSTVPVGSAQRVHDLIAMVLAERGVDIDYDVCSNPEFLKEGVAIEDFTRGARVIVGTDAVAARNLMRDCYEAYNRNHDKIIFMSARSAELTKYAANAMLAAKISLMNEFSHFAEKMGADIESVRQGIGADPRIGYDFIYPGCGYGGSCFPKDVRALISMSDEHVVESNILRAVEQVNNRQKTVLFQRLYDVFEGDLSGRTIAVWGLSFKPGTDDLREAPSLALLEALWQAGASVRAYDPVAMQELRKLYPDNDALYLADSKSDALRDSHALVICTEWKQFRSVDFNEIKTLLACPVVVDGRNLYSPEKVKAAGLRYYAIGRGDSLQLPKCSRSS
jgi:UDPglucose 6-dehydrogenase